MPADGLEHMIPVLVLHLPTIYPLPTVRERHQHPSHGDEVECAVELKRERERE
jgi:hypothetical protein